MVKQSKGGYKSEKERGREWKIRQVGESEIREREGEKQRM